MTEIKVNTENMRTTANAFQDKIDEWKGLVNQLWSLTEELNGMWEGDANISFNEMVDADPPRFVRLAGEDDGNLPAGDRKCRRTV